MSSIREGPQEHIRYEMQDFHNHQRHNERTPSFYHYSPSKPSTSDASKRQYNRRIRHEIDAKQKLTDSIETENLPHSSRQNSNYSAPDWRPQNTRQFSEYSNPFEDSINTYDEWNDNVDLVNRYHRTISLHRNTALKNNTDTVANRTGSRTLEERRKWLAPAGHVIKKTSLEQRANNICCRMEQDGVLMEDCLESHRLRREALRDMPQCLTVKRIIKKKLAHTVTHRAKGKPLGLYKNLKYRMDIKLSKMQVSLKSFTYSFELWYNSLKVIEGQFGSAVATYFKFFRWLFILNTLIAITVLGFIVTPELLYQSVDPALNNSNVMIYDNSSTIIAPEALLFGNYKGRTRSLRNSNTFDFHNIFTGEGYFANTAMFYGFYTKNVVNLFENQFYYMPYAYFFTMFCIYAISFVILSISMARSYRRSFIETQGGLKNMFAHKIFCGWDYSIATQEAGDLKAASIYHELKELLSDSIKRKIRKSLLRRFWTTIIQIIINIAILVTLVGIGYATWFLLKTHSVDIENVASSLNVVVAIAVGISLVMRFLPPVFSLIVRYEDYKHPRIVLYITLVRTFLLKIIILGVLEGFWLTHFSNNTCWETVIGQHIYRLIVFDFLFDLIAAIFQAVRHVIYKKFWAAIGAPNFDIATYTLHLMYNQTLLWVGLYFAPLISVVVVIKLWCTWYIRRTCILYFCRPSSRSWRAAQTHTCFLILSFLSLLLVLIALGYVIVSVPSSNCGPFQDYSYVYEMVLKGIFQLEQNNTFWKVLMYLLKPGSVALILIAMCVVVYYFRARAFAQKDMVDILRNMLVLEAKDKEFLLENISKVTEGQWQYHLEGREAEVWKSYEDGTRYSEEDKKFKSMNVFDYSDEPILNAEILFHPAK